MAQTMVGFDIGASELKIAVFTGKKLKQTASVELPDNLMRNGEIQSMDAMTDLIRAAAKEHNIPHGPCGVILPSSLTFTRNVTIPPMTQAQLRYNLPFEFRDYVTEEKGHYFYDYAVQQTVKDENDKITEQKLFACATLKSTIASYRDMLHRAGFKLTSAIPEEYCYSRLVAGYEAQTGAQKDDYCIVDFGHTETRVNILHGSQHDTRRIITIAGIDLDQMIADFMNVDIHMAHGYKAANYEDVLHAEACMRLYTQLSTEIMKTVNFYNFNNPENRLQKLYISGGGAVIEPLINTIAKAVQLEIRNIRTLFPKIENQETELWMFAKAIGCGMQD